MERNGWFDDSYMWSSTPFLLQKTDRGGREMGGQLLHGPLLHSALSDRKAHRARREMSGQLLQDVKKGWHSTLEWLWMQSLMAFKGRRWGPWIDKYSERMLYIAITASALAP